MKNDDEFVQLAADVIEIGGKIGMVASSILTWVANSKTIDMIDQELEDRIMLRYMDQMSVVVNEGRSL